MLTNLEEYHRLVKEDCSGFEERKRRISNYFGRILMTILIENYSSKINQSNFG